MDARSDCRLRQLVDPTTGRPILMAPQRQQRPILTAHGDDDPGECPFCPGNEASTPPEVDAWRPGGSAADGPGWTVRAFPNKYPAAAHHEVLAEGATHREQPADLGPETWAQVISVWQRRVRAIEALPGVACAFLFKNVGILAGASIPHSHSQLLGLDALPPRIALELQQAAALPGCPWCETVRTAAAERRVVADSKHHVALVPDPPKLPYEMWILPRTCDDDFVKTAPESLAEVLHRSFAAVRDHLAAPDWNLWLHRAPGTTMHWHFELQPRTGHLAGLELGGDMYINSVPAEAAAARLRGRSGA